jgi:hypothetical protein
MTAPRPVAISLQDFPDHAAIIGDILLGYSDLEFFMVDLVGQATGDASLGTAVRLLYRLKGSANRLNVADALLRPFMAKLRLHGPYSQWHGAMTRCRIIRNQYAHCGWSAAEDILLIANFEEAGKPAEGPTPLQFLPLELSLLKEQQAYFGYAIDLAMFLMSEARFRRDRRRRHHLRLPKSRAAPKPHSPLN